MSRDGEEFLDQSGRRVVDNSTSFECRLGIAGGEEVGMRELPSI